MLILHKGHTDTIQVYSVTVMTHVKALQAGHSSQGTSEPITPVQIVLAGLAEAGSEVYVSVWGKPAEAVPAVSRKGTQLMNKLLMSL